MVPVFIKAENAEIVTEDDRWAQLPEIDGFFGMQRSITSMEDMLGFVHV